MSNKANNKHLASYWAAKAMTMKLHREIMKYRRRAKHDTKSFSNAVMQYNEVCIMGFVVPPPQKKIKLHTAQNL